MRDVRGAFSAVDVDDDEDVEESSVVLSELLSASSHSPLLRLSSSQFDSWSSPHDRHYALLVFLTASQQCVQCGAVEREIESLASDYEAARFTDHSDTATHHIFFASIDAHRSVAGERRGANMEWFQANGINSVPQMFLLDFTVPEGLERGSGALDDNQEDQAPRADADDQEIGSVGRRERRMAAMRQRRWDRYARLAANASQEVEIISNQSTAATLQPRRPVPPTQPPPPAAAQKSTIDKSLPNWRDPNQIRSYQVNAGMTRQQLHAFLRQHTEQHVKTRSSKEASTIATVVDKPLHRSLIVRPEGVLLPEVASSVASEESADFPGMGLLVAISPFVTSLFLFATIFILYLWDVLLFAHLPVAFFLWNIVGAMNNIKKNMPLIGMGRDGPMFFYPGHGAFVGESIFMAILCQSPLARAHTWSLPIEREGSSLTSCFCLLLSPSCSDGYCAFALLFINRMSLWERHVSSKASASRPTTSVEGGTTTTPSGTSEEEAAAKRVVASPSSSSAPPTTTTMRGGVTRRGTVSSRAVAADLANPLELTPTVWAVFFITTMHFAFSLIRTVYTGSVAHRTSARVHDTQTTPFSLIAAVACVLFVCRRQEERAVPVRVSVLSTKDRGRSPRRSADPHLATSQSGHACQLHKFVRIVRTP